MGDAILAPFPWPGGKSRVAPEVWARFGDVPNYVEPFAGSLAVLLGRPHNLTGRIETVNDLDCYLANVWRATQAAPEEVANHCDWPVNEADLHARHMWLVAQREEFALRVMGTPDFYDAKVAGWWVWGLCQWIGSGWCSGSGPWRSVDGLMVKVEQPGCNAKLPHLGNAGRGINRKLPHLGDAGMGINRKLPHLGDAGRGQCEEWAEHLQGIFATLRDRLRRVRVCCGDWTRVLGPTPTEKLGITGVFLDPPYSAETGRAEVYMEESPDLAHAVREWAIANGDNPRLRVALCGYDTEHAMPASWECMAWHARGGYECQAKNGTTGNRKRERIWFSPHCIRQGLFGGAE